MPRLSELSPGTLFKTDDGIIGFTIKGRHLRTVDDEPVLGICLSGPYPRFEYLLFDRKCEILTGDFDVTLD